MQCTKNSWVAHGVLATVLRAGIYAPDLSRHPVPECLSWPRRGGSGRGSRAGSGLVVGAHCGG